MPDPSQEISIGDEHRGPQLFTVNVVRHVKLYALYEGELSSLSLLNNLATLAFSIASFCGSQAISVHIGLLFGGQLSDEAKQWGWIVELICVVLCIVFAVGGILLMTCKNSELRRIKGLPSRFAWLWEAWGMAWGNKGRLPPPVATPSSDPPVTITGQPN